MKNNFLKWKYHTESLNFKTYQVNPNCDPFAKYSFLSSFTIKLTLFILTEIHKTGI